MEENSSTPQITPEQQEAIESVSKAIIAAGQYNFPAITEFVNSVPPGQLLTTLIFTLGAVLANLSDDKLERFFEKLNSVMAIAVGSQRRMQELTGMSNRSDDIAILVPRDAEPVSTPNRPTGSRNKPEYIN